MTQLEKCRDDITDKQTIIQNITEKMNSNDKELTIHHNKLRQIRHQIKDKERDINSQESRLANLRVRVKARLKTIKEREQELIDIKLKNDLEFVTKMNALNNVSEGTINEKIEVLNKVMGITI